MRQTDIQKGDKVRFLNDVGGGVVTRVEGKTIYVEDEIGFEVPMPISEIVVVEKHEAEKVDQTIEKETKAEDSNVASSGNVSSEADLAGDSEEELPEDIDDEHDDAQPRFYLAFLDGGNSQETQQLNLYVVNDSNYSVLYVIVEMGENGLAKHLFNGRIHSNTKEYLDQLPASGLDVQWHIQLMLYRKDKAFPLFEPVSERMKIKANKFFRDSSFKENDFFYEKAALIPVIKNELERKMEELSEKETQKILREKGEFSAVKNKQEPKKKKTDIIEVDLHIHELLDDTRGLSNADMLKVQMDQFHKVMEENLKNKGQKIVFIHGIGNGTLKHEVRRQLNTRYKKHNFQDASFREYGFGATMVII